MTKLKIDRKKQALYIFQILAQENPKPTTELIYHSPFELLVAVVLSARATDVSVNLATTKLFAVASTPDAIINLGQAQLESYIKTIGLYKTKATNIMGLCAKLINDYQREVPNKFDELIKLPGVGRKTANVILNTLFGQKVIAVDTHVYRVSLRLGLACGPSLLQVEQQLMQVIPEQYLCYAHHWLILHGRYVCRATKPLCNKCPITNYCDYYADQK